jgi:hypothetical protein
MELLLIALRIFVSSRVSSLPDRHVLSKSSPCTILCGNDRKTFGYPDSQENRKLICPERGSGAFA